MSESTIEENILLKARQKRELDEIVMDEGQFTAKNNTNVFTKGGLIALLGNGAKGMSGTGEEDAAGKEDNVNAKEIEAAMEKLEDAEDVVAAQGAKLEAAADAAEFNDEKAGDASGAADGKENKEKKESKEKEMTPKEKEIADNKKLEEEFAAWQTRVGVDLEALRKSLTPIEQYSLSFKEVVDPYYSTYAVQDWQRQQAKQKEGEEEWNVEVIEEQKRIEEERALNEGDLLATFFNPSSIAKHRHVYLREKGRLRAELKRKRLTGETWEVKTDGLTQFPFYYNSETGEARWAKPKVRVEGASSDRFLPAPLTNSKAALKSNIASPADIFFSLLPLFFATAGSGRLGRVRPRPEGWLERDHAKHHSPHLVLPLPLE